MSEHIKRSISYFVMNMWQKYEGRINHWIHELVTNSCWEMNQRLADTHLKPHFQTIQSEVVSEGHNNTFEWSWQILNRWVDLVYTHAQRERKNPCEIMQWMSGIIKDITACSERHDGASIPNDSCENSELEKCDVNGIKNPGDDRRCWLKERSCSKC